MLAETQDNEEIIARVAALDIGKAGLVCCVRVPDEDHPGRRLQEVETYSAMTRPLLTMAGRLRCLGVTRVVTEATPDYRKPAFYLLEAAGFETWLVNAGDVKHLPGRPKTGKLDAVWLAKVAGRQMIRPGFVPPPGIRRLRDVTRCRSGLVAARTAEKQRAEKLPGGRADQAERGRLGHLRCLGPGDAGRAGRRAARPEGAGPAGPGRDARQDHRAAGGVHRLLHRSPWFLAGQDAGAGPARSTPASPRWTSGPGR